MRNNPIPLDDPEELTRDILPLVVTSLLEIPFPVTDVVGTGFVLGNGVLVTCWHCLATDLPEGHVYGAIRGVKGKHVSSPLGFRERIDSDIAWARVNFAPRLNLQLSRSAPKMGDAVWTFGYPLPERRRIREGLDFHLLHPRILKGHITRAFHFDHPKHGSIPVWELSFAAPAGLSGAPLFLGETLDVIGVVFGNNDVAFVEEAASVDPVTGNRSPEVQRITSFGLAHHRKSLQPLESISKEFPGGPSLPDP